jgi:hypothetical protein
MNDSIYENMMDILDSHPRCDGTAMLKHFVKLMGKKNFVDCYDVYFKDAEDFEMSFYNFQKSMRQTDFFDKGEDWGHVDMIFWNFTNMSDVPFIRFQSLYKLHNDGWFD